MFMASKLTCLRNLPVVTGLRTVVIHGGTRSSTLKACPPLLKPRRGYATKARFGFRQEGRTIKDRTKEALLEPATDVAIKVDSMGRMMLAGGAAVGLGALCYYGLGMSDEIGAIEKAVIWPQHVKDRIHSTYMYLSGSLGMTALSAVAVSRTPALMGLMMSGSLLAIGTSLVVQLGAIALVRSISYEESPTAKHLAWALRAGVLGAAIAHLTLLGGPLMMRAVWCTAGIVGGLSAVAMCAPSEKFLYMGGPLAVGLGVVFTSSLGTLFLPPTSVLGAGVHSVALYGGLLLFSALLLHDTQNVVQRAEMYPLRGVHQFDPINESMGI